MQRKVSKEFIGGIATRRLIPRSVRDPYSTQHKISKDDRLHLLLIACN